MKALSIDNLANNVSARGNISIELFDLSEIVISGENALRVGAKKIMTDIEPL